MAKAVALLSGGLDSTLAVLLLRRQGIEVTAIQFLMHFGCDMSDTSSCSSDATSNANRFGFEVKLCHLADKFTAIVKNPKWGHGRNMNPCIDCRILMLREAKEFMLMTGADFIATGEVLGQRPMSQRRETFPLIDREAGLSGYVLRPLSAKLMKPTIAEQRGLVNREMLCGFAGRSRKPQMALAKEFGLLEYPAPAGGCLLTEPNFSYRLKELLGRNPDPSLKELHLLKAGRHFRTQSGHKIIVGRSEADNLKIERLADSGDYLMRAKDVGSPLTLISAVSDKSDILTAASLCARYSDAKNQPNVDIEMFMGGNLDNAVDALSVPPASEDLIRSLRIEQRDTAAKTA